TNGSAWDVYAKVRGGRIYNVDLSIEEGDLVVHCDCSDFETEPCEHLWAAILAADGKGYLRGDGNLGPLEMVPEFDDDYDLYDGDKYEDEYEDEDEDEGGYGDEPLDRDIAPLFAGGSRSKEKLPSWKEQLAALGRAARTIGVGRGEEWSPARRIIYVGDVPATLESPHLILDTLLQDLKQNGEWGKPRKQRIPRWQIEDLPDPNDRQIFAMLAGSREQMEYSYYGYNYQDAYDTAPYRHRLTPPLPQIILPLIARTERCYQRLN